MIRAASFAASLTALLVALIMTYSASAQVPPLPPNGDFEAGAAGWAPATGGTFVIDGSQPVNGGAAAGHAQSTNAGTITLQSQYWLTTAVPTRIYAMSIAVRIPAATITAVTARLDIVDTNGVPLVSNSVARAGTTAGYITLNTTQLTAPANAEYVLVVVTATATAAGARFSIDDVAISETIPPPPPPPPPEAAAPPVDDDPGLAPPPVPTVSAPRAARASSTPIRIPTATPTRVGTRPVLVNGNFETNLSGWSIARGRGWTDSWIPGQGSSMVLYTPAAVTIWAEQVVSAIEPGAWYQASALLSARGAVGTGWLRIAWHSTDDGSGRSIGDVDSLEIEGDIEDGAVAPGYRIVGTGPVQAPPLAASATIRILVQTDGGDAWLIADDVTFGPTGSSDSVAGPSRSPAPLTPVTTPAQIIPGAFAGMPTPAATAAAGSRAGARPTATSTPRAVVPRASGAPTPTVIPGVLRALDVMTPGVADQQRAIRITQIMPDPANPGRDNDYEWIELTNLGTTAASLDGMSLRDNSGAVTLPALVIPAGGTLVLTARLAEVPGATSLRLSQSIGNGLGNSGDRLMLLSADGRQVDAFSYGDDTTFAASTRIPAPGTGRAIERRFAPDGTFRDAAIVDQPTPGRARPAVAATSPGASGGAAAEREAASPAGTTGATSTWVVLLAVGGGLLGGVAAQRIAALAGNRQ